MTSFIERIGKVWLDGEIIAGKQAMIPVLTHGLHYASCVFEGERSYGGPSSSFESTPTACSDPRH